MKTLIIVTALLMTGCSFYGGIGVHDKNRDYHMKNGSVTGEYGAKLHVNDHVKLYVEHRSVAFDGSQLAHDSPGYNAAGVRLETPVFWK